MPVRANAIYVGETSVNIYLTYDQAVQVATNFLKKAELIKDDADMAIQLWAKNGSAKLNFGLTDAVHSGAHEAWE